MSEAKLTKTQVDALHGELVQLETYVDPKPDPGQWPPVGWQEHPTAPGYFFRVLSAEDLREEIFGSEAKTEWMQWAKGRIEEIKTALVPYFFPKPQEEGVQRKTKSGFVTMLKTGLKRKFDLPALAVTVAECQKIVEAQKLGINVEAAVIKWEPKLDLAAFRELPPAVRKQFEHALIVEPEKPKFEIVRVEDSDENA